MDHRNYQYFDATIMDTLHSIMGDDIVELYREYAKDTQQRIVNIEALITDFKDPRQIQMLAHSLKGSSANVGASHMAGLCQQLEAASREGSRSSVKQVFQDIKDHSIVLLAELEQFIS